MLAPGVSPAALINTEAQSVMALMRQNARWAGLGQLDALSADSGEGTLFGDFLQLRRQLFAWRDFGAISPVLYLAPFLEVVRSAETSGPITGAALDAVHKFTSRGLIGAAGPFAAEAMHAVVDAVTHCRFEATDAAADEVVLVKILHTLLACVQCDAGRCVADTDMGAIVQACFRIGHQTGNEGELLRRASCDTLLELVRCVFARIGGQVGAPVAPAGDAGRGGAASGADGAGSDDARGGEANGSTAAVGAAPAAEADGANGAAGGEDSEQQPLQEEAGGLSASATAEGIFSFVCGLVANTEEVDESEALPMLGLALVNGALESGGKAIREVPGLLLLVQTTLFPSLYRLGLSPNVFTLSLVCSIVFNLYLIMPEHVKGQLETFVANVLLRAADGKGTSYNQQEVAVEALVDLCRQPHFMPDMYANYDCDLQCANVFEAICTLLSKNAFPVNPPLRSVHLLSLEGLLVVVHGIADRCTAPSQDPLLSKVAALPQPSDATEYVNIWDSVCDPSDPVAWVAHLRAMKYYKRRMVVGTDHFNRDPKKGFEFLQQINLLPKELDPQGVANFFRYTPGLSKVHLGEYLGDPDDFKVAVLSAFVDTFDFVGQSVDGALRSFLESFRLPGEAQKIARILEIFARRYYEASRIDKEWSCLKNEDAAYVLCYSIIMLNTDLWSSQVKKKMTLDQFVRNNRQINDGEDIPRELLEHVYEQIASCEIKMQSETTSVSSEDAGSADSASASRLVTCKLEGAYDRDIFGIVWGPAVAAMSAVYEMTQDDDVLRSMLDGFLAVAEVAHHYRLHEVVDNLVVNLCRFTAVLNPLAISEKPAVVFGRNAKARMATVTVFSIASRYGDSVQGGWKNILDCILRLHKLDLLPPEVTEAKDFPDVTGRPGGGDSDRALSEEEGGERGLFSNLGGRFAMFLTAEADVTEGGAPDARDGEAQERTARCIEALRIDELFADTKFMQNDSLLYLARSLIWASGQVPGGANGTGGAAGAGAGAPADEDIAEVCLSLLLGVTLRNRDRIGLLWPLVQEHVTGIIVDARKHTRLVERAVLGLLHLCQRLLPYKEELAEELLRSLQYVIKLDAAIAWTLAGAITSEVRGLVTANGAYIRTAAGWKIVCSLLALSAGHPEASPAGFAALQHIAADGALITPVNFVPALEAAQAFAGSRAGGDERSMAALDLVSAMGMSVGRWAASASAVAMQGASDGALTPTEAATVAAQAAEMWMQLLRALAAVVLEKAPAPRQHALLLLQRLLLSDVVVGMHGDLWLLCLESLVLPLQNELMDVAADRAQAKGYAELDATLKGALTLMSRVFLARVRALRALPDFERLWFGVIDALEAVGARKLYAGGEDFSEDMVPQVLKNMLLVMHSQQALLPESTPDGRSLWERTMARIAKIAPQLRVELQG